MRLLSAIATVLLLASPAIADEGSMFRLQLSSPLLMGSGDAPPIEVQVPEVEPLVLVPGNNPGSRAAGSSWLYGASATGGQAPLVWSMVPNNPGGSFSIDPPSGTLSGTSLIAGSYGFTVRVTDALGTSAQHDVTATFTQASATPYSASFITDVETTGEVVGTASAMVAVTDASDTTYVLLGPGDSISLKFDRFTNVTSIGRRLSFVGCTGSSGMAFAVARLGQGGEVFPAGSSEGYGGECNGVVGGGYGFHGTGFGVRVTYTEITPSGTTLRVMQFR